MAEAPDNLDTCSLAPEISDGQVYNEAAFRYFLTIERKRADESERPFLLLLVDLKPEFGTTAQMDARLAATLFSGLSLRLRETDFLGWYRHEHVIGAVLTQRAEMTGTEITMRIAERLRAALCADLSPEAARRLQVRLYQLSSDGPELGDPVGIIDRKNG
jgi:hypothetical protein